MLTPDQKDTLLFHAVSCLRGIVRNGVLPGLIENAQRIVKAYDENQTEVAND